MRVLALSIFIVIAVGAFGCAWASEAKPLKRSFVDKVYKVIDSPRGSSIHFYQQAQVYVVKDKELVKKLKQQMQKKGTVLIEAHPFEKTISKVDIVK